MRRTGGSSKPEWIEIDDNFIGIAMGADFTSEHEWGIKDMKRDLGIMSLEYAEKKKVFGSKRYQVKDADEAAVFYKEKGEEAILLFYPPISRPIFAYEKQEFEKMTIDKLSSRFELHLHKAYNPNDKDQVLATAWDSKTFGIRVSGEDQIKKLQKIRNALLSNDMLVFLGAPPIPAFSNGSLNLMILSQSPKEGLDELKNSNKEHWELKRDAQKTGIEKKLEKAGKRWFALKPSRGLLESKSSKHDIMFFLNPMEQKKNNFGWFTVEELEEWAKDRGPVIMEAK